MTDAEVPGRAPSVCAQCGTQIAPALLACPSCRRLVYAEELKRLAATADGAEQAGDPSAALAAWRQALDLVLGGVRRQQVERLAPGGQGGARPAAGGRHPAPSRFCPDRRV